MSLKKRLFRALGGMSADEAQSAIHAAEESAASFAASVVRADFASAAAAALAPKAVTVGSLRGSSTNPDNPAEQEQWRRLGRASTRNLADWNHKQMVSQCSRSATVDGMSRAHVRLVRSITVGAQEIGVEVRCKNDRARKRLQELIDIGWKHPTNDLSTTLGEFMDGLTTTGSLAIGLHTDENAEGKGSLLTTIGYLDPEAFVSPGVLADPGNVRDRMAILRGSMFAAGASVIAHPIIRNDDSVHAMFRGEDGKPLTRGTKLKIPRTESFGGPLEVQIDDPCMYVGINQTSPAMTVGVSDIYPALDILGLLDELVFGAIERSINIGAYSLHVKFPKGTPEADITERMNAIRVDLESGRGRAVGTTDDVTIQAVFAQLQAGEWATLEKVARVNALIAMGPWPVHIFSDGGTTNVATAAEQGSPVANFLLDRQNAFRKFFIKIATYMLRRYPEARRLIDENPDFEVRLHLPVIVSRDTTRESNVFTVETNTLTLAVTANFIKRDAAARVFRQAADQYGFSFAPGDTPTDEEVKKMDEVVLQLPRPGAPRLAPPPEKLNEGTPTGAQGGEAA